MGSFILLSSMCAQSLKAQPLSAKTELTVLMDVNRLHIGARNVSYAQNSVKMLLMDATQKNDEEKKALHLTDLGLLTALQNDLQTSDYLCRQGLEARERLYGASDRRVADSLNALAIIALYAQNYPRAEQYANSALLVEEKDAERNALRMADSYDILARTNLDQGKFARAEAPAVKAWQMRAHVLGSSNPVVSQSLYTMAIYHAQKGEVDKAHECLQQSLVHASPLQKATSLLGA